MNSDGSGSERSSGRLGRVRERWRNTMARYLVIVLFYLGLWGVIWRYFHGYLSPVIDEMSFFTANAVYETLGLFWANVGLSGRSVSLGGFTVFVIGECVGLLEFVIYSVFVLAYPTEWRAKFLGLVIGPLVIFAFNVSRISLLLFVAFVPGLIPAIRASRTDSAQALRSVT